MIPLVVNLRIKYNRPALTMASAQNTLMQIQQLSEPKYEYTRHSMMIRSMIDFDTSQNTSKLQFCLRRECKKTCSWSFSSKEVRKRGLSTRLYLSLRAALLTICLSSLSSLLFKIFPATSSSQESSRFDFYCRSVSFSFQIELLLFRSELGFSLMVRDVSMFQPPLGSSS